MRGSRGAAAAARSAKFETSRRKIASAYLAAKDFDTLLWSRDRQKGATPGAAEWTEGLYTQ